MGNNTSSLEITEDLKRRMNVEYLDDDKCQNSGGKDTFYDSSINSSLLRTHLENFGFCTKHEQEGPLCYAMIEDYVLNSQVHSDIFEMKILEILHVKLKNEPRVRSDSIWLWHGTREERLESIIQHGLQPPKRSTKGLVGDGIYFADRASKSAQYCYKGQQPCEIGYVLLCRVFVGKQWTVKNPKNTLTAPPTGYSSIHCRGEYIPDPYAAVTINGDEVPLGETIKNPGNICQTAPGKKLRFNEYVVFSSEQVQIQYLVKFKFDKK